MAPPWPFKKKSQEREESPSPIAYELGDDSSAKTLADKSHVESSDFKAAMAALSTPHLETTPSDSADSSPSEESASVHVQSSDGYWYLQAPDGTFDPTPHIKLEDGSFKPYE